MSVLGLFFVVLYFYSFLAFLSFRDDFINIGLPVYVADLNSDQDHNPDFNMYCDSLTKCLASVVNYGIRAGGGIGDVLK